MKVFSLFLIVLISACTTKSITDNQSTLNALQDIEGYTIASCLTLQDNTFLKDQGDAWASVIIQRMKGSPDVFEEILDQLKSAVNNNDMAFIRDENKPQKDKKLPILYCNEIINKPLIKSEIQKTLNIIEPLY